MRQLRLYQQEAVLKILIALEEKEEALLVMATGLGKTVVMAAAVCEWLKDANKKNNRVLFLMHMAEPLHQACKEFTRWLSGVSTSIVTGYDDGSYSDNAQIVFTTFQSCKNALAKNEISSTEFDLVIVDEAHHAAADTFDDVLTEFVDVPRLGVTATPERMDGRDIRDYFGEEVYSYGLEEALAEGTWLARVDYHLVTDNLNLAVVQSALQEMAEGAARPKVTKAQIDKEVFVVERLEAVKTIVQEHQGSPDDPKRTIIFCHNIRHVREVSHYFPDAVELHSEIAVELRRQRLEEFRAGNVRTLLVVDMLNEAIDVPEASLMVFLRSTTSETIWRQQLGRGLRKTPTSAEVTVLDFVGNCHRIGMLLRFIEQVHGGCVADATAVSIRTGIALHMGVEFVDICHILDALKVNDWMESYAELQMFHEKHGHSTMPQSQGTLGTWCGRQRTAYRKGELSAERIALLEAIGFVWDMLEDKWQAQYTELQAFHEKHGHSTVPQSQEILRTWCSTQRIAYRKGKLSAERIALLEAIGFVWNTFEDKWQAQYTELKEFHEKHGHCTVPVSQGTLGMWCGKQRIAYRKGELSAERIALLNDIHFLWEVNK